MSADEGVVQGRKEVERPMPPYTKEDDTTNGICCFYGGCKVRLPSLGRVLEHLRVKHGRKHDEFRGTYLFEKGMAELSAQRMKNYAARKVMRQQAERAHIAKSQGLADLQMFTDHLAKLAGLVDLQMFTHAPEKHPWPAQWDALYSGVQALQRVRSQGVWADGSAVRRGHVLLIRPEYALAMLNPASPKTKEGRSGRFQGNVGDYINFGITGVYPGQRRPRFVVRVVGIQRFQTPESMVDECRSELLPRGTPGSDSYEAACSLYKAFCSDGAIALTVRPLVLDDAHGGGVDENKTGVLPTSASPSRGEKRKGNARSGGVQASEGSGAPRRSADGDGLAGTSQLQPKPECKAVAHFHEEVQTEPRGAKFAEMMWLDTGRAAPPVAQSLAQPPASMPPYKPDDDRDMDSVACTKAARFVSPARVAILDHLDVAHGMQQEGEAVARCQKEVQTGRAARSSMS